MYQREDIKMADQTFGEDFGKVNFPPRPDPANEETGVAELYPESLQDEVNETYNHDKVLPRSSGKDYTPDKDDNNQGAESVSTFPHKY